mgnify:CR=1 FL=1
MIKNLFVSIITTGLMLFLMSKILFTSEVSYALGGNVSFRHLEILAFFILYTPISRAINILAFIKSRKNEYEADNFAETVKLYRQGKYDEASFRRFRLQHGAYGTRMTSDYAMVRVKLPAGEIYPKQFEKYIDKLYSSNLAELKIVENFDFTEGEEFEADESEDTISLLNRYIQESEVDLDKSVITEILQDVYKEACEVE